MIDPAKTLENEPIPQPDKPGMHDLVVQYDLPLFRERYPEKIGILDKIEQDLLTRKQFGLDKYGTMLQEGNGRCSFLDAYHETLDLIVYLRLAEEEATLDKKTEARYLKEGALAASMKLRALIKEVHNV